MDPIIEVTNLSKSYGKVQAVKDISFYVEKGKMFAFLGPNGAGKSTTIDIICTFLQQDSGMISIDGYQLGKEDDKIRSIIGAVFQDGLLDALLTVEENMRIRGGFYGAKGNELAQSVQKAAEAAGVTEFMNRPYGKLSGGQRRRADIARALVHTPKILILDEPTTGLDPQTRKNVWEIIKKLQKENNMTVFLTTHYMEEAADADYVVVIDNGNIAARGTPTELKNTYASDQLNLFPEDIEKLDEFLMEAQIDFTRNVDKISIKISSTLDALPILEQCKPYIKGFEVLNGTMDDAFIGITGKEIRQ
ncbi:ABC transporter ATP-binding protein [Paenibacillus crassostreae]|uniref:ABC transporter n=1 Tax=Paenibacillus crassostreae TaxID=1763538 RepID=A0A167DQZ0_9BACL|nr:ABC transporter [Paenibacillus crassostreae]OAB74677.1 ABC transporter [Paenibacillus crassostreae]